MDNKDSGVITSASPSLTIEDVPRASGEVGGRTEVTAAVVGAIGARVAREAEWIHSLGKSRFLSLQRTRGVAAEVGEAEAALDLEVVINYGCDLAPSVAALREAIAVDIGRMAGRRVVEVNVNVVGVHVESKTGREDPTPPVPPRVR